MVSVKKMRILPQILSSLVTVASFATAPLFGVGVALEEFLFDDVSGTALDSVANTGTQGSVWNYGAWTTDGNGNLAFDSGQGIATRKLPGPGGGANIYESELQHNSGKYRFEIDFDVNYQDNSAGDLFAWGVNDADGQRLVRLVVREKDGNLQVQFSSNPDDGNSTDYRNTTIGANDRAYTDLTAAMEFDFTGNTVDFLYNGNSILGSPLNFDVNGNTEIGQLFANLSGTWTTTAGTNAFNLDRVALIDVDAVPEPGSFALAAGLIGLVSVILRRR